MKLSRKSGKEFEYNKPYYSSIKSARFKYKNALSLDTMELNLKEANLLFEKINKELLPRYKGKIIAIDTESGEYFIGDSELDAYKKAIKNISKKQFIFKRIGFASTHFVGAL